MKNNLKVSGILFLITLLVYGLSYAGEGKNWNYFVLLADAFLHGRLYLSDHPSWLNELINWQGKFYVVYPPMPAVLLMPFVAIFGKSFSQPAFSIILGSVNVALSYLVFLKLFQKRQLALWMSLLFGFGTIHWFHAEVGSAWYIAHIVAIFFLWLALLEITTRKRLFIIGLLIGAAYLARLPTILAAVFVPVYLSEKFFSKVNNKFHINFKNLFVFGFGLSIMVLLNWAYNYARYGTIEDISYRLLPIFNEPWYQYGLFNIRYIPTHLNELFTALPKFSLSPPFLIPSLLVMSIWFVTPAFLLSLFAKFKTKIAIASLVTVLAVAIPSLVHGSNGFTQFGYRFSLDYTPFLLILVASAISREFKWWAKALIILSILVNLWGVIMISHLKIWIM